MRKLILMVLLGLGIAGSAQALDKCYSGSYYNPATDGAGFDIQVSESIVVVYHFGYIGDTWRWFYAAGANSDGDEVTIKVYEDEKVNGKILSSMTGNMTIYTWPTEPNKLTFSWEFTRDWAAMRAGNTMGWCMRATCTGEDTTVALFRPTSCE